MLIGGAEQPDGSTPMLLARSRHAARLTTPRSTVSSRRFPTAAQPHVRAFAEILTTRSGQHLKDWITATRADDLPGLHTFATGLEKDWDAVVQGLTTCWNSGAVEGRVNHIKMVKRQMFGLAKLPLLRKRVLLTATRPLAQPVTTTGHVR
ncbi:transposase [Streptomyces sp. NPDC002205]|uniref:transposase n=1 Tax=Streptomyces sp. NPDC002205 TaxID=3154411 RepID=UPI003317EF14